MFLPKNEQAITETKAAEQARRKGYSRIEGWVTKAIPTEVRKGVTVSVQEVECGDPEVSIPLRLLICQFICVLTRHYKSNLSCNSAPRSIRRWQFYSQGVNVSVHVRQRRPKRYWFARETAEATHSLIARERWRIATTIASEIMSR